MTNPRRTRTVIAIALTLAGLPAAAADLPHHRSHRRPILGVVPPRVRPVAGSPVAGWAAVVPAVPLAPVVIAPPPPSGLVFMPVLPDPVLAPRRGGCAPGFMVDADGACRRSGELLVACDPYGGPCHPLPPTPIPYGIGPYLRPNY